MRIGFIGLGMMGTRMSANLLKAGFAVTVYNRTRSRMRELVKAGAAAARSLPDLAQRSDVVLTCLGTVGASEEVFLGPDGVVEHSHPGQILIDHSTVAPRTAREIARAAAEREVVFLDAPISGGPEGAEAGTLTIMVGGDRESFLRVQPVLLAMGQQVRWVGAVGSGCVIKLVNQALTAVHAAAAAEAMTFGTRAGADPVVLLEILQASFGQSRMLERSAGRFLARDFSAATRVKRLFEDLALTRELGDDLGLSLPLTRAAADLCQQSLAMGLGEADIAALVIPFERAAGIEVAAQTSPSGGPESRSEP